MDESAKQASPAPTVPGWVRRLLERIQASEDQELVYERGGGWWIGLEQTSGRGPMMLLRLVLIRSDDHHGAGGMERWTVNEEGRKLLDDPGYVPTILRTGHLAMHAGRLFRGR